MKKLFSLFLGVVLVLATSITARGADVFIDGRSYSLVEAMQFEGQTSAPNVSPAGEARMYYDYLVDSLYISMDGAAYTEVGVGAANEGSAILSTGESGGTKFLREDGDGTSSWQPGISAESDPVVGGTTGIIKSDGADNITGITTSAGIAAAISNETGSGVMVFGTSPTFTTQITVPKIVTAADLTLKLGDNAGSNKWSLTDSDDAEVAAMDSDGNLTCTTVTTDPSAAPSVTLKDLDASAGDDNYILGINATDPGDGTEDIDIDEKIQIAGTPTTVRAVNADGSYSIGTASMPILAVSTTPSEIIGTDASKNLVSLAVATYPSLAELAYLKGVSSSVQTQITARGSHAGQVWTGVHDYGGASSIEVENAAGDIVLAELGAIGVDTAQGQLAVYDGIEKVIPLNHMIQGNIGTGVYDTDSDVWMIDLSSTVYPDGIVITAWYADCNEADPDTELDANLMYCDNVSVGAFPGANPILVDVMDTTTGNSVEATMSNSDLGSGVIPPGKTIYIDIDADPTSDTTLFHVAVRYYIPES